jgi:hypothetical protein
MRSAGNFSPEWGYLAPAPSFMRTARIVLVATAIGATAGAGVVLSLVDHPAAEGDRTSVAAHAIVTSVQAATTSTEPLMSAPVTAAAPNNLPSIAPGNAATIVPAVSGKTAVQVRPAGAAQSRTIAPPQIPAANPPASARGADATVPQSSSGIAALSEPPSATEAVSSDLPDGTTVTPGMMPPPKKTTHHSTASDNTGRPGPGLGTALRQLFSAHAGTSYYPGHGL